MRSSALDQSTGWSARSSNTQQRPCDTTLENLFRPTNDIIAFSGDLRYTRVGSQLFHSRLSTISTSFEILYESASLLRGQIASREHYLVLAYTSPPRPHVIAAGSSLQSDHTRLTAPPTIKHSESNINEELSSSDSFPVSYSVTVDRSCHFCHGFAETYYHCKICEDGQFDVCQRCFYLDNWCKDQKHTLSRRTGGKVSKEENEIEEVSFSAIPKHELSIFSTTCTDAKPHVLFSRSSWTVMNSHPAIHPTQPILFWLLDQSQLLVGNCSLNSYVVQTLRSSPKSKPYTHQSHIQVL